MYRTQRLTQPALTEKVSLTIPSTYGLDGAATEEMIAESVRIAQNDLTLWFGGSTTYTAQGTYRSDEGKIITEDVTIVTANTEPLSEDDRENIARLAELIKCRHRQECVAVTINNDMYFV